MVLSPFVIRNSVRKTGRYRVLVKREHTLHDTAQLPYGTFTTAGFAVIRDCLGIK